MPITAFSKQWGCELDVEQRLRLHGDLKDGLAAVESFELGEGEGAKQREARALRQRQASNVIAQLLNRIAKGEGCA